MYRKDRLMLYWWFRYMVIIAGHGHHFVVCFSLRNLNQMFHI